LPTVHRVKTDRSLIRLFLSGLAVGLVLAMPSSTATAQTGVARDSLSRDSTARDSTSRQQVAVVIFAAASAGEVSFKRQPQLHVRLSGGLDSVHVLDRRNLPSPVVAGTTYRNVYIAVELFGRLNADCIARTLTGGAATDCASLELHGTSTPPRSPGTPPPTDSSTTSTSSRARPPRK
jgi:hypothetical protein